MREMILTAPEASEIDKRVEAAVVASLDSIAKRHEDRVLEGVAAVIERHGQGDRSEIPDTVNSRGEAVHRLGSPTSRLYRNFSRDEKKLRNPDTDHWGREFIAGVFANDGARQMQAKAKLDTLHPDLSRADTLEGAADASGGFAAGTGGVLLPRVLEELVAINRDNFAKMARFASTYQMTAQEHNIPTGAAMTAYMVGEATSPITQGEPSYAQVPLIAHREAAKAIMGNDVLEDAAINVMNFVTQRGGSALAAKEDLEFFQEGTGSAPHVTKLDSTAFAEATTAALAYTDVVNMYTTPKQRYRANARWFVASDVLGFMANVRDGQGRPFYASLLDPPMVLDDSAEGGPMAGAQGTLLGRPVHEVPLTPGEIWFGDPAAAYAIGRRQGIRVDTSREFYFDTFRTILLLHQRIAGNNVDTVAAAHAKGITSATSL